LKGKKPDQSDKFKIRKLEFCPFAKAVEGFGSVMWIWEYQGHHATSADLAGGLRAHYLCTEKSLTGGADRVLVHVDDLGKKLQFMRPRTRFLTPGAIPRRIVTSPRNVSSARAL
jgi:hypothetical protein